MRLAVDAANSSYFYIFAPHFRRQTEEAAIRILRKRRHRQPATKMKHAYQNTRSKLRPQPQVIRV
jgi:hypothetical protein